MKIHFISIGGSVMHQLAIALKLKGYNITGSDDEIFEPSKSILSKNGLLPVDFGWFPDKINTGLDAIILGMHAKTDNPELLKARELNLQIYSFPEYIYQESKNKTRIVVGGSHGKTTTTAMVMHALKQNKKIFDYLVGAKLQGFEQSVNITDAPVIVCEGDEYPASTIEKRPKFHFLFPHIAVITGIAWDHINIFPTFENYLEQFRIFIEKIEQNGHLIYNETDPVLKELVLKNKRMDIQYHPYGIPQHQIQNGITSVQIEDQQSQLKIFGDHNLLNLHAAWIVCSLIGISAGKFLGAMKDFKGASKRLEWLAGNEKTVFYRDFAHAPSKVKATISAVKNQFPDRKLIAVLELHTYSSLNEDFLNEYSGSLDPAESSCVFYSRHALKLKRMPDLSPAAVAKGFNKSGLHVFNERQQMELWLRSLEYNNAVVVFMSSGNYDGMDIQGLTEHILQRPY